MTEKVSINQVRRFILDNQYLRTDHPTDNILKVIKKIHNVQIDTISVVTRAHDLTLFNRVLNYKEKDVWKYEKQKKIFEYFSHVLCFLPIEEYPFYTWIINYMSKNPGNWTKNWLPENKSIIDRVFNHVKKSGPTCSADFKNATKVKREGWWELKAENIALKYLFHTGKLLVSHRKGFQRYYDIPERVLPPNISSEPTERDELPHHMLEIVLRALGLASVDDIWNYLGTIFPKVIWNNDKQKLTKFLEESISEGALIPINIETIKDKFYLTETDYNKLSKTPAKVAENSPVKLLSPFDNLIRDRYYPKKIWNFDYKFEAYVPKNKRELGFFLLPILDNCELIGNIDAKVHRKEKKLELITIYIYTDLNDNLISRLSEGISLFAKFNNCAEIYLNRVIPEKFFHILKPILES
ncbi:MAG: winged helix-turn-helix domain-containing protein [Candidatus Heimdallarchaeota archaeon]